MTDTRGDTREGQLTDDAQQSWLVPLPHDLPSAAVDGPAEAWRAWLGEPPSTTPSDDASDPLAIGPEVFESTTASATSWVDDDVMAPMKAGMRERAQVQRRRRLLRRVALPLASIGVSTAVVVGGWLVLSNRATDGTSTAGVAPPPSPSTAAGTTPVTPAWCTPTTTSGLIIGNGPGERRTATGVILAQQFELYARRDPVAVRALLAPDARVASEEATREAIAAIPAGTQHCVRITPAGPDRWNVQISEKRPDGSTPDWQQFVTTAPQPDGRVLITAITAGEG